MVLFFWLFFVFLVWFSHQKTSRKPEKTNNPLKERLPGIFSPNLCLFLFFCFLEVFLVFGFWLGIFSPNLCFFSFFVFLLFSPGFFGFWFLTEYGKCWLTRRLIGSDRNPVCLTPCDHYGPNTLKSEEYGNCTGAQAPFQFSNSVPFCKSFPYLM